MSTTTEDSNVLVVIVNYGQTVHSNPKNKIRVDYAVHTVRASKVAKLVRETFVTSAGWGLDVSETSPLFGSLCVWTGNDPGGWPPAVSSEQLPR